MKLTILALSFLLLFSSGVRAQRSDPRVDVARLFGEQQANQPGRDWQREQDNRLAAEFDQVERDLRALKNDLHDHGNRDLRRQFAHATQTNEQLRERFRHGGDRRDLWRALQKLRGELAHLRAQLPSR